MKLVLEMFDEEKLKDSRRRLWTVSDGEIQGDHLYDHLTNSRGTYSESTYYRLEVDRRTGKAAYSRVVCWCDSLAEDNDGRTERIDEAEVPDEAITHFMEALKRAGVRWE